MHIGRPDGIIIGVRAAAFFRTVSRETITCKGVLPLSAYQHGAVSRSLPPVTFLAWLGGCGILMLQLLLRGLCAAGRSIRHFFADLLHGLRRIYRFARRILLQPIRLRGDLARRVDRERQAAAGQPRPVRVRAALRILIAVFLSENGIFASFFRYAVPVLCCAFLFAVVRYGTQLDYSIAVTFNGTPIGCIAEEEDYAAAEQIVRRRLSYTEDEYEMDFARTLRLSVTEPGTELLTAGELADRMLQNAEIELADGWGVYVNDEFLGAVADVEPIKKALMEQLSDYYEKLGGNAENVRYADSITYEKGTYLSGNLKRAEEIIRRLTAVNETTETYSALAGDTLYSVAMRFSTDIDTLRGLNPELPDVLSFGTKVTVPRVTHSLPILYSREVQTHAFVDYDTRRTPTNRLAVGKEKVTVRGVKGERSNTELIQYTDGRETTRRLLRSEILSLPQDEEISVGTYEPHPASTDTRLDGNGQFAWPLNGGRISDVFISNRNHRGLDIAAPTGTEIYAAEDGIVTVATMQSSYGNYVKIDHLNGYETVYAHCSALLVAPEQEVTRGQIIALVGSTGHSTGPHLHFEVRRNGMNYNPADYLRVNAD